MVLSLKFMCCSVRDFAYDSPAAPERVSLRFSDGSSGQGEVLIGADGIHSQVRRAMRSARDTEPHYAGWSLWTGLSRLPTAGLEGQIWNLIGESDGRVFLLIDVGGGISIGDLQPIVP